MVPYDLYLYVHIAAAIIWVGSGFLLHILAFRAERANDAAGQMRVLRDMGALGNVLFVPASLVALVFGLLMVIDGPWSFSDLWIILGLAGYAATFCIGMFILKPRGEAIGAMIQRDGGVTTEAVAKGRQLATIGRIEAVILFLVVAVMVLKPAIDDVGILAALAAVLVGGTAFFIARARSAGLAPADA
ncbi:MAG: DUF2269 family protein [Bauldia sp.]|uniref:DUF2269 family protein n=1 Tax=Bauldia sp. TaxID=2575872 RepID=UPI001D81AD3E|nr:DUF2269 family protein [Bauldia sp.]MCB1494393.1 DUF2269 family protein [Bauldia sp.]